MGHVAPTVRVVPQSYEKGETDEEVLVGILLTLLGAEGLKIYDTFAWATADDAKKIKPVLDKFTLHFKPRSSEVYERFMFLRSHQLEGESCESWLLELRSLIKNCNYQGAAESILRDQLVLGVADSSTREKLLYEQDLQLAKAIEIIRLYETSK